MVGHNGGKRKPAVPGISTSKGCARRKCPRHADLRPRVGEPSSATALQCQRSVRAGHCACSLVTNTALCDRTAGAHPTPEVQWHWQRVKKKTFNACAAECPKQRRPHLRRCTYRSHTLRRLFRCPAPPTTKYTCKAAIAGGSGSFRGYLGTLQAAPTPAHNPSEP